MPDNLGSSGVRRDAWFTMDSKRVHINFSVEIRTLVKLIAPVLLVLIGPHFATGKNWADGDELTRALLQLSAGGLGGVLLWARGRVNA